MSEITVNIHRVEQQGDATANRAANPSVAAASNEISAISAVSPRRQRTGTAASECSPIARELDNQSARCATPSTASSPRSRG